MCLSWVTLLVEMGFKPIQLKPQLCASIQSQNRLLRSKVSWDSVLFTDGTFAILAQVRYASKSLNKAQSRFSTTKRELLALVNYTRHFKHYLLGRQFKIITNHRALQWLHNFKDPDALTAHRLKKLAAFHYEIEHRSGKSIGHADCMSRLPATTAALNMTATMDLEASVVAQPNHSSQNLPSFNSHPLQHNRRIAPPCNGTPLKAIRLMMSSLESNTATKPVQTATVGLMMSSLRSEMATKP